MTAFLAIFNLVPRWAWAAAVAALVISSVALKLELSGARADLNTSRTQVATLNTAIAEATAKAATQSAELSNAVLKAQNDAKIREALLRTAAAAASSESDGLRNDLADMRGQLGKLSADALVERTVALGDILTQCASRYRSMAEKAQRHASDVKTLIDSWPK